MNVSKVLVRLRGMVKVQEEKIISSAQEADNFRALSSSLISEGFETDFTP